MPSVTTSRRVSLRELAIETDVPADFRANGPAAFLRDPLRHRARRDTPRLQQQHAPAIDQRRRHSRRLAGAGRGSQHRRTVAVERGANGVKSGINRQRWQHGVSSKLTCPP